jgi:hypothetical protein
MAPRTNVYVSPDRSDWKVTTGGTVLSRHRLKQEAVSAGVLAAQARRPSELIIQRADGTIEDKRTYGDDPYPPKG